jgi:apoptosis-inducing factor 2
MSSSDKLRLISKLLVVAPPFICELVWRRVQALQHSWAFSAVPFPKDIIVIGGSFTGVELARRLYDSIPTGHRVTLIEKNSHLNYVINFARYSVLKGHDDYGFIPYHGIENAAPPGAFRYIQDTVVGIEDGSVHLEFGQKLDFACLAIATGSQQAYPATLVATEKEDGCKRLQGMQQNIQHATRIAVIGAGAVGIELATDIKSFYPEKDVTIFHSRNQLLPHFGSRLHEHVLKKLQEAGIHVRLQERPEVLKEKGSLRLTNGSIETYDLIVSNSCDGLNNLDKL